MLCLSCDDQDAVDRMSDIASQNGGTVDINPKQDHDFMYSRSQADFDGHVWVMMWMSPSAIDVPECDVVTKRTEELR
ncbi:VOC family protein [Allorhodopirellula solitaria]|uniref:Glyoxalase-like domain protein n=1 Tax=Allorhodopirellula solitaria TaxID=2527987 RepID=A0A5C5YJQ3_9BACT|nr:hypothetical protein [Allorhodopirellula solitaria]TWT75124.1 hypothetical protein CA85_04130 [Allorhodopirellula solitaria]